MAKPTISKKERKQARKELLKIKDVMLSLTDSVNDINKKLENEGEPKLSMRYTLDENRFNKMFNDDKEIDKYIMCKPLKEQSKAKLDFGTKYLEDHGAGKLDTEFNRLIPTLFKIDGSKESEYQNRFLAELCKCKGGQDIIKKHVVESMVKYNSAEIYNNQDRPDYIADKYFENPVAAQAQFLVADLVKVGNLKYDEGFNDTVDQAMTVNRSILDCGTPMNEVTFHYTNGMIFLLDLKSDNLAAGLDDYTKMVQYCDGEPDFQEFIELAGTWTHMLKGARQTKGLAQLGVEGGKLKDGNVMVNYKAVKVNGNEEVSIENALNASDKSQYRLIERTPEEKEAFLDIYKPSKKQELKVTANFVSEQLAKTDVVRAKAIRESDIAKKLSQNSMFFSFMQSGKYDDLEKSVKDLINACKEGDPHSDIGDLIHNVKVNAQAYIDYKKNDGQISDSYLKDHDSRGYERVQWAKELLDMDKLFEAEAKNYEETLNKIIPMPTGPQLELSNDRRHMDANEVRNIVEGGMQHQNERQRQGFVNEQQREHQIQNNAIGNN